MQDCIAISFLMTITSRQMEKSEAGKPAPIMAPGIGPGMADQSRPIPKREKSTIAAPSFGVEIIQHE